MQAVVDHELRHWFPMMRLGQEQNLVRQCLFLGVRQAWPDSFTAMECCVGPACISDAPHFDSVSATSISLQTGWPRGSQPGLRHRGGLRGQLHMGAPQKCAADCFEIEGPIPFLLVDVVPSTIVMTPECRGHAAEIRCCGPSIC